MSLAEDFLDREMLLLDEPLGMVLKRTEGLMKALKEASENKALNHALETDGIASSKNVMGLRVEDLLFLNSLWIMSELSEGDSNKIDITKLLEESTKMLGEEKK